MERFYDTVRQDDMPVRIFAERIERLAASFDADEGFLASIMLELVGSAAIRCASISRSASLMRRISRAGSRALGTRRFDRIAPNAAVADRFGEAAQRIGESLLTGIKIDRAVTPFPREAAS